MWNILTDLVNAWNKSALAMENAAQQIAKEDRRWEMVPPAMYDGDARRARAFLQECEGYFLMEEIEDLKTKIYFVLSRVKEGANKKVTRWADSTRSRILERAAKNPPEESFSSWDEFKADFERYFEFDMAQEEARRMVMTLEQGNMTYEEYYWEFASSAGITGFNDVALQHYWKRGLNKGLRARPMPDFVFLQDNTDGTIRR
ncbi:unnamed protein product [Cyclocybe aegerita]|uniref:Retrotransposon gag domain-containing protein n=1 Tax=Cyclocybe aegerita TaxID=1973307 RepID=A0A8S0WXZ4_CYCAE|nr:unnamed protein product [Cyclocybe aegerita]